MAAARRIVHGDGVLHEVGSSLVMPMLPVRTMQRQPVAAFHRWLASCTCTPNMAIEVLDYKMYWPADAAALPVL